MALELHISTPDTSPIPARDLLRLASAGSVDDGKSTLIGRLLYDTDSLPVDHMEAVRQADGTLDFAALSDGLRSEREQGITIDVAYRYFSSPRRNYILADTPGHELYTRNMFTGASTADVAILLIDAEKGVLTQTRRHAKIADLLGVKYIIAAVNKMDRIHYDHERYQQIYQSIQELATQLNHPVTAIPLAAKLGDNIVHRSEYMPWYDGPTLFEYLENLEITSSANAENYLPIQGVIRAGNTQKRRYMGRIESGSFQIGDDIVALPTHSRSTITALDNLSDDTGRGITGQSIAIELADNIDVGRGSVIALTDKHATLQQTAHIHAVICWFHPDPVKTGQHYSIKLATQTARGEISSLQSRINLTDFTDTSEVTELVMNDIGEITLHMHGTMLATLYQDNPVLGSFIMIEEKSQNTAGAGFITQISPYSISQPTGEETWISGNPSNHKGSILLVDDPALVPEIIAVLTAHGLLGYQINPEIIRHDSHYIHILPTDRWAYHTILALRLADAGVYPIISDTHILEVSLTTALPDTSVIRIQNAQQLIELLDSQ